MDQIPISVLLGVLFVLLLVAGFFSAAETSMMAVNRYRLKHMAKAGHRGAKIAEWLLARTEKLLGVVLLGNNLVNAASASLLTIIAFRLFGENEMALTLSTLTVTFLILVFSEVTPKVIGAAYPERIAPKVGYVLAPLLKISAPAVWFVNLFVQGLLRLLRLRPTADSQSNTMGVEELRTLLLESGQFLPGTHRGILLNLFELEQITVDDVMRPRSQVEAIDLEADADTLIQQLMTSHHDRLPVYAGELNNVRGILHVRRALSHIHGEDFDHAQLEELLRQPYYIPSGTPLFTQLAQFQNNRQSMGLVVDEYGEIVGLITIEDVLEEIVGEFSALTPMESTRLTPQDDGSYLVDGAISLRELNRRLDLDLPLDGPRTLNGLILEQLEAMPEAGVSLKLSGHPLEIVQVHGRVVKTARIHPLSTTKAP